MSLVDTILTAVGIGILLGSFTSLLIILGVMLYDKFIDMKVNKQLKERKQKEVLNNKNRKKTRDPERSFRESRAGYGISNRETERRDQLSKLQVLCT